LYGTNVYDMCDGNDKSENVIVPCISDALEGENIWIYHPLHNDYTPISYGNEILTLSYLEDPLDSRSVVHSRYRNFPMTGFPVIAYNKVNNHDSNKNT
jgi:hypothetical protein